jgi:vacuolar protein sorting-associated protein 26
LLTLPTELFYDRGSHYEFLSLSQELAAPGEMRQAQTFDFHFKNVEKQFESYMGINVKLRYVAFLLILSIYYVGLCAVRYFIRVTISRRLADIVKEKDLWVHSYRMPPDSNNSIKMEVGIEDCLHIEFEYNKSKYVPPNSHAIAFISRRELTDGLSGTISRM